MSRLGIDYSWARPTGNAIKAAGYTFACRYLSHDDGKNISVAEANDLRANGIDLVLVYESYANRALGGEAAGLQDGKDAAGQAKAVGYPQNACIYAAVDFDSTEAQQVPIDAYLKAFEAGLSGFYETGVYGSYYVCKRCHDNATAVKYWQTLAWSGGQVYENIHIYQNGKTDFGNGADVDEARQDNIGAWKADNSAPSPKPTTQPNPVPVVNPDTSNGMYTVAAGDTLSSIAQRFGTTYQALAALNGIADPNQIQVGEVIRLGNGAPAPIPNGTVYTVAAGDTLSSIGTRFGVAWRTLQTINGITDPNKIYVGQSLRIAGGLAPSPTPEAAHYTVQSGDTLGSIASRYGTTYQHLAAINGIADPNKIYAGQVIAV